MVLKLLMEADPQLFDECSAKHRQEAEQEEQKEQTRQERWALLKEFLHARKFTDFSTKGGEQQGPHTE